MFVAASGLIRAIWRLGDGRPTRTRRRRAERRGAGMTAATPTFEQVAPETERRRARGAPIRADPRRRVRVLRPVRVLLRDRHLRDDRDVLVLDQQAGRRAAHARRRPSASCGSSTGVVTGRRRPWASSIRGAPFPWRRTLLIVVPLWVVTIMASLLDGKAANLTGVITGSLEYAVPVSLGAFAGILSERSGMLNIAIEGKFLIGARRRPSRASVLRAPATTSIIGDRRRRRSRRRSSGCSWRGSGIRWKVDQIISGVVINIGALGITNFLFLRVLSKNTELNTPADRRADQHPDPVAHPGPRPDPVRRDAVPVLHADRDGVLHLHAVPDALGPAAPGVGREAVRGRHGRHRRDQDPLPLADPGRDPGRASRARTSASRRPAASRWR